MSHWQKGNFGMRLTQKVFVQHVSIQSMEEAGWELSDGGVEVERMTGQMQETWLLDCFTRRQRQVANLLTDGFSRRDAAKELKVSHQAIHQIVLRMRKRLKLRMNI